MKDIVPSFFFHHLFPPAFLRNRKIPEYKQDARCRKNIRCMLQFVVFTHCAVAFESFSTDNENIGGLSLSHQAARVSKKQRRTAKWKGRNVNFCQSRYLYVCILALSWCLRPASSSSSSCAVSLLLNGRWILVGMPLAHGPLFYCSHNMVRVIIVIRSAHIVHLLKMRPSENFQS